MTDPATQSLDPSLLDDLELQQAVKDCYDAAVQLYVDHCLIPQSLADEMKRNTTGAELMKGFLAQMENFPYIRIPIGELIVAHRELPSFYDDRPEHQESHFFGLRRSSEPVIRNDGFIKIIPTEDHQKDGDNHA